MEDNGVEDNGVEDVNDGLGVNFGRSMLNAGNGFHSRIFYRTAMCMRYQPLAVCSAPFITHLLPLVWQGGGWIGQKTW